MTFALVGCGGAATPGEMSTAGVRAAATQLIRSVNAEDWYAVRDQMATSYYHLVGPSGAPDAALAGVLPHPVNSPPITTDDVPAARVTINGSHARVEFPDGVLLDFTYQHGHWLVDS